MISWIGDVAQIVVLALTDSISIHKTFLVIASDSKVLTAVGKCLAVNIFLLLGSIAVFDRIVAPLLAILGTEMGADDMISLDLDGSFVSTTSKVVRLFYTTFWLIPIWGLCFVLSMTFYSDIATQVYQRKHLTDKSKKLPQSTPRERMLSEVYVILGNFIYVATVSLSSLVLCIWLFLVDVTN